MTPGSFKPPCASPTATPRRFTSSSKAPLKRPTTTGARNAAGYDLSHSLYWGGIPAQLSVNGQAVTDYALSSASGTDYRLSLAPPVPEPTSAALLFAGLGLVAWLKAWRRRAPGG